MRKQRLIVLRESKRSPSVEHLARKEPPESVTPSTSANNSLPSEPTISRLVSRTSNQTSSDQRPDHVEGLSVPLQATAFIDEGAWCDDRPQNSHFDERPLIDDGIDLVNVFLFLLIP